MEKIKKIALLRMMIRIRVFEEKCAALKMKNEIPGPVHTCIGQEATAVGVCGALDGKDYVIGSHRSHGIMIAKGIELRPLMAEIYGKSTGTNRGKGGSMHVNDREHGALGASAIVGSGMPLACGAAFASQYLGEDRVTCVFFGDGASNEGAFSESLNLASLWKLPVLFILENNAVAVTTVLGEVSVSQDLYTRGAPYGVPSVQVDGQDVELVHDAAKGFVEHIRSGKGPALIEAKNLRFNEHQEGPAYARVADSGYRDQSQVKVWIKERDPIRLYATKLIMDGQINASDVERFHAEETRCVDEAVEFSLNSPDPEPSAAYTNIFSE